MTYRLSAFNGGVLPTGMPKTPVGTAPSVDDVISLPGGGFFDGGNQRAGPKLPYDISYQAKLLESTPGSLESDFKLLRHQRGLRAPLERTNSDATTEWCTARLLEVQAVREPRHQQHLDVTLTFRIESLWYGTEHDVSWMLVDATQTILVTTGGSASCREIVLTITATGTPITGLTVSGPSSEFTWTGTLAVGTSLVIDCGQCTIKNAGVDAYNGFTLTANHEIDDWLLLPEAGWCFVTIARTGGDSASTARIQWTDLSE